MMNARAIFAVACCYPAISVETAGPCRQWTPSPPSFLVLDIGTRQRAASLPSFEEDDVLALHRSSLCRANLARSLCVHLAGHVDLDGRAARFPSGFVTSTRKPEGCRMCAVLGRFRPGSRFR